MVQDPEAGDGVERLVADGNREGVTDRDRCGVRPLSQPSPGLLDHVLVEIDAVTLVACIWSRRTSLPTPRPQPISSTWLPVSDPPASDLNHSASRRR
jgi:hypothetical protein